MAPPPTPSTSGSHAHDHPPVHGVETDPVLDLDTVLDALRAQGSRITAPRRAVIETLIAGGGHLSAEDVADALDGHEPPIHLSTVYRTLEALEELGIITHAHVGHGRAIYRLAGDAHLHAECDTCGRIIHVAPDALDALAATLAADQDFDLQTNHFSLLGRCAECRADVGATPHRHGRR